ncbi:hypothetical protein D4764_05G0010750 [Takifugu flavidus]|uniref:Uncharacterized protein n=1 Tax=Takifugu flavidus TaxID=433684 RepID=A0A5C6N1L9_9TELE|nr:hypothetical protein D4764_05G0010750 [Takifugu flavidus]
MLFGSAKKLTAGWRRWVALPQREPFTDVAPPNSRHGLPRVLDPLLLWLRPVFGTLSCSLSRSLSLSPPFARGTVLRATAGTQPLVEGVFLTPRV